MDFLECNAALATRIGWSRSAVPTVGALGDIDISTCDACGGAVKVIPKAFATLTGQALASIEDPHVIKQILPHLEQKAAISNSNLLPESRAPPPVHLPGLR